MTFPIKEYSETKNSSSSDSVTPLPLETLKAWFNEATPWKSGFLSLLRAVAARDPMAPLPGTAHLPDEELYRLGQQPTMIFAPREIASIQVRHGRLGIRLYGLGIWGAQGPLPLHLTELAYTRIVGHHDDTLMRFADLFHHRALSQFYRAWASSQATASLDRRGEETFSLYVGSLGGIDPKEAEDSCLPVHARLASVAHLVREARNPDGISATLSYYFGVPVLIQEFIPHWIDIPTSDYSRLGHPGTPSVLGEGALLGTTIADSQHKFRLVLGPLELDQYLRFTPQGNDLQALIEWVRAFIGYEYAWDVKLLIKKNQAPSACADTVHKLGYSTWLGKSQDHQPITGMVFEPEQYNIRTQKTKHESRQ
ncbi:type VI secretion system baseplate subunit TssG [Glaciimonas sp. CA11.2]|uniref:type VI secretion system baseplate subunit TssG n=1 Tax=unclassified Glaciimonas TaxID=2644401 RepID=UPI002AB34958|nr:MULTISPECIES: type VI secretion system baseplate subunit TssG [unclassified Glaciimonas]MDY7544843.1 type VI secretion system baseplate subunit TssG [Glaciimonas sp. CA11.2]MEB0083440.1 type VI secretion system baseplate subunit TssG [Glaciimonas sp. Gout2]MEB0163186.1 type VI secretion system baseplate subunit TssG [Glaciimonas sp. CA11.2]